ncbi:hypothetical protein K439DRAFT_1659473 [Ramaria rubella]|nr:hypothetical protein K439DRAFT_1659473 [Ramaria rubella]
MERGGNRSRTGRERALAYEVDEPEAGRIGASQNGEISVIWTSSQGGCDPLQKLLKDVEKSQPPPPTQRQHSLLPNLVATQDAAATFLELSQASSSSTISRASSSSSSTSVLSTRKAKRSRPSLTHLSEASGCSQSPTPSWSNKGKLLNPSSDVLSRVSRSLNEKAVSEYTTSQRRKIRKAQPPERPPPRPRKPHAPIAPVILTQSASSSLHILPRHRRTATTNPNEPVHPHTTTAPTRSTSITKSPQRARIKALLETIDHAGPFHNNKTSQSPSSTPHARGKLMSTSQMGSLKERETNKRDLLQPDRKSPSLGMRRPVPLQVRGLSHLPQARATTKVPLPQTCSNTTAGPSSARHIAAPSWGVEHPGEEYITDSEQEVMDVDASLRDRALPTKHDREKPRRKSKGYRAGSPGIAVSLPFSVLGSPPLSDDDMEVLDNKIPSQQVSRCTESCAGPILCSQHRVNSITREDELEANVSSDGTSSSYGDIDIDPAALEEACKVYDG